MARLHFFGNKPVIRFYDTIFIMKQNNSPWLTQLNHDRTITSLENDLTTDVVIVGGGIAGVVTMYFLLTQTNKNVVLLEGHRLGHGATGHNAGQVVAEFERPLVSLVKEHGLKKAVDGLAMVQGAWDLLADIMKETEMDIPFKEFIGYAGFTELSQFIDELENELIKHQYGLVSFPALVSRESRWMEKIPKKFHTLCTEVDEALVEELLEVGNKGYKAIIPEKKATLNSALFAEKLALWCLDSFKDRAQLFEKTFVQGLELKNDDLCIITDRANISCQETVLCTNGFENFYIRDKEGLDLDTKFHHLVQGVVGYMTGFLTKEHIPPMANKYFEKPIVDEGEGDFVEGRYSDVYFYVTQRAFGIDEDHSHLLAIGGPEISLAERELYFNEFNVPEGRKSESVEFARRNFSMEKFEDAFFWHGLMGYTRTGVRVVGREPIDPRLLYNLGCNGVGIMPSIMGGLKIARHINGEEVEETIFDPVR